LILWLYLLTRCDFSCKPINYGKRDGFRFPKAVYFVFSTHSDANTEIIIVNNVFSSLCNSTGQDVILTGYPVGRNGIGYPARFLAFIFHELVFFLEKARYLLNDDFQYLDFYNHIYLFDIRPENGYEEAGYPGHVWSPAMLLVRSNPIQYVKIDFVWVENDPND